MTLLGIENGKSKTGEIVTDGLTFHLLRYIKLPMRTETDNDLIIELTTYFWDVKPGEKNKGKLVN